MHNLEIKCVCSNLARAERLARAEPNVIYHGRLTQTDVYFHVRQGRLKLRHIRCQEDTVDCYELISYRRPNRRSARSSFYHLLSVPDGPAMLAALSETLGIRTKVHKLRKVYLGKNLRIHLDRVQNLGTFLEFEILVSADYPLPVCRRYMRHLLNRFGISPECLIGTSYAELLNSH